MSIVGVTLVIIGIILWILVILAINRSMNPTAEDIVDIYEEAHREIEEVYRKREQAKIKEEKDSQKKDNKKSRRRRDKEDSPDYFYTYPQDMDF